MAPFGHKTKVTPKGFCREFYDSQVFNVAIAGHDMSSAYWDTVFRSIVEADESFAGTDKDVFVREMNAMRLELFGLAWGRKFKKEKYTIPQSTFTRQYLKQNGKLELWDIMGEYNRAIADSVTLTENGERMGDRRVDEVNLARLDMLEKWLNVNVKDTENLTEEEDEAVKSFTRVANRIGADVSRNDCILVKRLGARLADRLGCSLNLGTEALFRLAATIYGLYQGAMEAIKDISLQS
jgi:hypothetical protein